MYFDKFDKNSTFSLEKLSIFAILADLDIFLVYVNFETEFVQLFKFSLY